MDSPNLATGHHNGLTNRAVQDLTYDIAIIGGGINGCGIARDAAGRGLSVFLCDQGDFAAGTSSASTKLVHGGLRYLEQFQFRLVREALSEREVLLHLAPHVIRPLRFVLPHHRGMRSSSILRLGLLLYDHLGGRKLLGASRALELTSSPLGQPLRDEFRRGFVYSDCWADDARLVILNAIDAAARGAHLYPRTSCVSAAREGALWRVTVVPSIGDKWTVGARTLINAAGPWAARVSHGALRTKRPPPIRLIKGSHIVVRKLFEHDHAYIFQNADRRIVFAIPYEQVFTLIGTTDVDYVGDPDKASADVEEIDYLCRAASAYFRAPVFPDQVKWSYSGVRSLYDDGASEAQEANRDYILDVDVENNTAPLVTVIGGKITTYRRLAESVLDRLASHLPIGTRWTAGPALPGGDFPYDGLDALLVELRADYPFLTAACSRRLIHAYGTRARAVLGDARRLEDLGQRFGADLTEAEVAYLINHEWASCVEDVLWRRSKLGLHMNSDDVETLTCFMGAGRRKNE
jgi:glycerol-3-phosphate dehydrogenase